MLFRRSISSRRSLINLTLASWDKTIICICFINNFLLMVVQQALQIFGHIWTHLIDSWLVDDVPGVSCIAEGAQSLIIAAAGWWDSWRKMYLRINSTSTETNAATIKYSLWMAYLQSWWFWSCHPDCLWEARWGQSPCREWSIVCARCPIESWTDYPQCSLHPHWAHC